MTTMDLSPQQRRSNTRQRVRLPGIVASYTEAVAWVLITHLSMAVGWQYSALYWMAIASFTLGWVLIPLTLSTEVNRCAGAAGLSHSHQWQQLLWFGIVLTVTTWLASGAWAVAFEFLWRGSVTGTAPFAYNLFGSSVSGLAASCAYLLFLASLALPWPSARATDLPPVKRLRLPQTYVVMFIAGITVVLPRVAQQETIPAEFFLWAFLSGSLLCVLGSYRACHRNSPTGRVVHPIAHATSQVES